MTETADRMNSHSKARKRTLMTVSGDLRHRSASATGRSVDEHPGGPDLDPRALPRATAWRTFWPLTVMPLVEPRSTMSICGPAGALLDPDLGVPPRDARIVDPEVGLAAAADHQAGRLQRVPGAVDLEHERRPGAYAGASAGPSARRSALGPAGSGSATPATAWEATVKRPVGSGGCPA